MIRGLISVIVSKMKAAVGGVVGQSLLGPWEYQGGQERSEGARWVQTVARGDAAECVVVWCRREVGMILSYRRRIVVRYVRVKVS